MKQISLWIILMAIVPIFYSCRDDMYGKQFLTSDDVMIDDYITQKDETGSMTTFLDVVDKAGFRGMLHAYGTYTCFIPDNNAMKEYFNKIQSSVNNMTIDECVEFVKYHVVRDTLPTADFVDGRLKTANMLAKFITTRARSVNQRVYVEVNRQALITQPDIKVANGYIHKMDHALIPPDLTVGEQIMKLPGEYSLFKNIMEETGWIDTLTINKADEQWFTVFLQDNNSFIREGINSRASLIEHLKKARPDILKEDSLLWTFAAYHCIRGLYYVADLTMISALLSSAPNQAVTFKLSKDSVLVNEYYNPTQNVREKGIPINKKSEYTDFSCYNGVLLDLEGYIGPVKRRAMAVFWKPCAQPEIVKDSRYRTSGFDFNPTTFPLSEIKWNMAMSNFNSNDFGYEYSGSYASDNQYTFGDRLKVNLYRMKSIEFIMPLLTEGDYNVWFCWRRADTQQCRIKGWLRQEGQEDQEMPNTITPYEYNITNNTDAYAMLAAGQKRYVAKARATQFNSRLFGPVRVLSTGRHTLVLEIVDQGRNTQMWIDMIQFIPIDDDQLWPRFDIKGNYIYKDTPCNEIYPYDLSCAEDNALY